MNAKQIPINYPTPRTDSYPKLADPKALCYELERELTEANHHRAVFEALWTGASEVAGGDPVQRILELRKELAEANHLRERAESSLSGTAARMRKAQDKQDEAEEKYAAKVLEMAEKMRPAQLAEALHLKDQWEKKFIQQKAEEKWANRTAFLTNPLHDVLDEMDSRGGNAIQRLAAYIRACDPERKDKALIAFRDDLECYDRKLAPTTHPETPVV